MHNNVFAVWLSHKSILLYLERTTRIKCRSIYVKQNLKLKQMWLFLNVLYVAA